MRKALVFLPLAAGCIIPVMPPPTHFEAMNPAPTYTKPTNTEFTVTPLSFPPFVGSAKITFMASPIVLPELQGSIGPTFTSTSPGLWIVTRGGQVGGHFGVRIGGALGMGDVLGVSKFAMPYAGANLHLQYAHLSDTGATFAFTFGAEGLVPLFPDTDYDTEQRDELVILAPIPSVWASLDFRWDIPLGEKRDKYFVIGAGADVFFYPFPNLTLGARF